MCVAVVIAVFLLYRFFGYVMQSNKSITHPQKQNPTSSASSKTQTNSEGEVTVKVTPTSVSEDKKSWQFQIALETHSGSLDTDLIKNAVLTNDRQNTLLPVSWNGSPLGGHHREGELVFSAFQYKPKSVTLLLKNIGGIKERKFTWNAD